MTAALRNQARNMRLAILGSGPSLSLFRGGYDRTIAVNGASLSDCKYDYFMCGDFQSPTREWFLSSQRIGATRVVANFLAPFDPVVIPDVDDRLLMQRSSLFRKRFGMRPRFSLKRFRKRRDEYYNFDPIVAPFPPHHYFYYNPESNAGDARPVTSEFEGEVPRYYFGATIAGVALQLASYMGAAEIHLYGVDLNNFDGKTYYDPAGNTGRTTESHVRKMAWLSNEIQKTGTGVFFHTIRA
jgi:hypothetical protein